MYRKMLEGEVRNHKGFIAVIVFFMSLSSMLFSLTLMLTISLTGAIETLMYKEKTPDFVQMHTGEFLREEIDEFAKNQPEVAGYQVATFLNLDNSICTINAKSLADSSQDNGLWLQSERFDYLLDEKDEKPTVESGEIYLPVCYQKLYQVKENDLFCVGEQEFIIKGFIRDSQMNPMLASSKRFLVCKEDFEALRPYCSKETIIEFLAKSPDDADIIQNAYELADLPANGPAITKGLIRMMNALSDGILILIILMIAVMTVIISLLCIRFVLLTRMAQEQKEIGILKALGISSVEIRKFYFSKYLVLAFISGFIGYALSKIFQDPLEQEIRNNYGISSSREGIVLGAVLGIVLVLALVLLAIWNLLNQMKNLSAIQALFESSNQEGRSKWKEKSLILVVVTICMFFMLLPANIYNTISSDKFVTCMGIGEADIRIDVRKTERLEQTDKQIETLFNTDNRLEKYVKLVTKALKGRKGESEWSQILIELGNHTVFPVTYSEGRSPVNEKELAVSVLLAKCCLAH